MAPPGAGACRRPADRAHGNRPTPSRRRMPVALASTAPWRQARAQAICDARAPWGSCTPGAGICSLAPRSTSCGLPPGLQKYHAPGHGPRHVRLLPPRRPAKHGFASDIFSMVAQGRVQSVPKREDSNSEWFGHITSDIGNLAMLPRPLHIRELRPALPDWGWLKSPRRSTRIPDRLVPRLLEMAGIPSARDEQVSDVLADLESIYTDPLHGPTEKETLCATRIGQGQFRQDLESMWKACAATGRRELPLLRASHSKPWRASTDAERLDPYNGLLLVANLDVAFDSGYIRPRVAYS
jgi:hypothetical protein